MSTGWKCHHCGARKRLRPARTDPGNLLCGRCWDRFGGRTPHRKRSTGQRRARPPGNTA